MLISQIARPFGYLFIKHPYKWVVDWLYPAIFAVGSILLFLCFFDSKQLVTEGGFSYMILSFVQCLPGFYIAALAAIATFGRSDIDDILPEPTPQMVIKKRGKENTIDLTRRRFLAMLFAFLTAESIVIVLVSIFLNLLGVKMHDISPIILVTMLSIYILLIYQMILATFWGLYYLGYKLHE